MPRKVIEAALLLGLAGAAVGDGVRIATARTGMMGAPEGGVYVAVLGALLAFLAVARLPRTRRAAGRWWAEEGIRWVPIAFAMVAGYVLLIGYAGYVLSTALFFAVYLRVFGSYRWAPIVIGSVAMAAGSAYLWAALGMMLPTGVLPWP